MFSQHLSHSQIIERTYPDFLFLHIAEAEQLVERTVRTIRNCVLTGPCKMIQSVRDRFGGFREAFGIDGNDVLIRQALDMF